MPPPSHALHPIYQQVLSIPSQKYTCPLLFIFTTTLLVQATIMMPGPLTHPSPQQASPPPLLASSNSFSSQCNIDIPKVEIRSHHCPSLNTFIAFHWWNKAQPAYRGQQVSACLGNLARHTALLFSPLQPHIILLVPVCRGALREDLREAHV